MPLADVQRSRGTYMNRIIDLRSDTVTVPTEEMRRAMYTAEVGDDVYAEDPTIKRLEELAAARVGKEAALFVPTGTMGNQVAILTHTARGEEVVVEAESHVYYYEVGGIAALSGCQVRTIPGKRGVLDPHVVEGAIRGQNIHFPRTSLVCVENTHNRAGGTVIPPEAFNAVAAVAHARGVSVHLDGARIFNAAVALGIDVRELVREADSVMFCLSKGLAAPVGSILAGRREWIDRARKNRKLLGGGMRQAGILAAAGIIALEKMIDRLAEDHANARRLAEGLAQVPGIALDLNSVQTNMIAFDVSGTGMGAPEFSARLAANGVKVNAMGPAYIRAVTHKDVTREDVDAALRVIATVVHGCGRVPASNAGFS